MVSQAQNRAAYRHEQNSGKTCISTTTHNMAVSLPILLQPYAIVGTVQTECCGEPQVTVGTTSTCGRQQAEICLTQQIRIKVPISYGATAQVGTPVVRCGAPNSCRTCRNYFCYRKFCTAKMGKR